jgi:hypothetical protein
MPCFNRSAFSFTVPTPGASPLWGGRRASAAARREGNVPREGDVPREGNVPRVPGGVMHSCSLTNAVAECTRTRGNPSILMADGVIRNARG